MEEVKKKCSNKKHSEINAISYCADCNLYLCNKCLNMHLEYLETHHTYNLDKNIQEIFTGLCKEENHKNQLQYYCKDHNLLCCSSCISKIKEDGNGKHFDCNVIPIKDIKEEKKSNLKENIKNLENATKNLDDSIKKLKEIYEKINETKEEMKLKISKLFTKIRNLINEREEQLFKELDGIFDKSYFKEDLILKGEKMPNQIKALLEKGKNLDNEWNNDNKLVEKINDCINIENNIKNIKEIYDNIEKCNSKKIDIKFIPEDEQITDLADKIKNFGEILCGEFKFKFQPGNNYNITKNGLIATKNSGGNDYNCVVLGEREIPKDRISKWKIKIVEDKTFADDDIYIGIGPNKFNSNLYDECWSIFSYSNSKIYLQMKDNSLNYNNQNITLKKDDIIEVIVDRKLGNLSFAVNGVNCGIACSTIPKDDILYPTVVLFEQGISVEII